MDVRALRYFLAVSEELHFGRAAAKLNISQPPLSTQIARLEREWGTPLFVRTTRRVELTPAGEVLADRVRALLEDVDALPGLAADAAAGRSGHLTVGFVSSAATSVLPGALRRFREHHPGVELRLRELSSAAQIEALAEGGLDVGLVRGPAEAVGLTLEPILEEDLLAVLPSGHRLTRDRTVEPADLVTEPMVLVPQEQMPHFVEAVRAIFRPLGARPRVVQEAVQHDTIVGLVAGGLGVSVLPSSVVRLGRAGVEYRPIAGDHRGVFLHLATRLEGAPPALGPFVGSLHAAARQERGSGS